MWQLKPPANTDAHGGLASRVDAHAAATERRLAATRGGELAEKDDDAKRREKIQNPSVAEAADAFALFD